MKRGVYLSLLMILISSPLISQTYQPVNEINKSTKRFPYQILSASGLYSFEQSKNLEQYDFIMKKDSLVLVNGHFICVHYSGRLIEITGSTELTSNNLNEIVFSGYNRKPRRSRQKDRPNLHYFLGTSSYNIQVEPDPQSIDILYYPPSVNVTFRPGKEYCLAWASSNANYDKLSYTVRFKDLFDKVVDSVTIRKSSFRFTIDKYIDKATEGYLILDIVSPTLSKASNAIAIKIANDESLYYSPCHITDAIGALNLAFYIESREIYFDEATKMYIKATELSDLQIYKELLQAHLKRGGLAH